MKIVFKVASMNAGDKDTVNVQMRAKPDPNNGLGKAGASLQMNLTKEAAAALQVHGEYSFTIEPAN